MNKYLSYKKSKRLAELGYCPQENPALVEIENARTRVFDDYSDSVEFANSLYQNKIKYIRRVAIDCHDLLMELQKTSWLLEMDGDFCVFKNDDVSEVVSEDPNPVECLGAALIKLLEEKLI